MSRKTNFGGKVFDAANYTFLILTALLCIFPLINVLAVSFSSSTAAAAGEVKLWPVGFNLYSYKYTLSKPEFLTAFVVSLERVGLGLLVNMICTVLAAYPLSKGSKELYGRNFYAWFFLVTMLFSGGLIPWYMTIKQLHLIDTLWSLVLPGAVPIFNVLVLLNFFRQLPKEISESAIVDGTGHWGILWRMYIPLSVPALATLILFTSITHWNSWFDGMILMTQPRHYPLQTYLQSIIVSRSASMIANMPKEELQMLSMISDRTLKASQIFVAAAPVLLLYPFLQKYFTKGIVLGSVKG